MRGLLLVSMLILLAPLPAQTAGAEKLAYYSDYFSFVGSDAKGFAAFALDNNRGVDGDAYQAEHFGVLYDQRAGWISLKGTGAYKNRQGELVNIPDSEAFSFAGTPANGLIIRSDENDLILKVNPVDIRMREESEDRSQSWGIAAGSLFWQGREIHGRVIYEGLVQRHWNRLTRTYVGHWDNFQGFYLALEQGSPRGFINATDWTAGLVGNRFQATDKALAFGFYRWPQRWKIEIKSTDGEGSNFGRLDLQQISRNNISTWIIGRFAMSVVQGELVSQGQRIPVIGFAELIQ